MVNNNNYIPSTNSSVNLTGNLTVNGSVSIIMPKPPSNNIYINDNDGGVIIGETNTNYKIYIVEPWQSKNPILIKEGLWISLESDLIPYEEIKTEISKVLDELHPDISIKYGCNSSNITLVKNEVSLEINKLK